MAYSKAIRAARHVAKANVYAGYHARGGGALFVRMFAEVIRDAAGHVAEHVAPLLIHAQPARRKVNGLILKMNKHGLYEIRVGIVGAMHRFAYAHDICRYSTAGQFFLLHAHSPLEA